MIIRINAGITTDLFLLIHSKDQSTIQRRVTVLAQFSKCVKQRCWRGWSRIPRLRSTQQPQTNWKILHFCNGRWKLQNIKHIIFLKLASLEKERIPLFWICERKAQKRCWLLHGNRMEMWCGCWRQSGCWCWELRGL